GEDLGPLGPGDADDIIGMGVSVGTTGYVAMDAGTSFSTPLVAGTAALLVEEILAKGGALSATTYTQVLAALRAGATPVPATGDTLENAGLGAGILNLRGLLA
ncbi:MAG TPA: S8 family serine peptidase, partial [Symbiobacteriaceae bacterium]|nr:S8 family serine peptidase [Symbiobacteriaceae bacterium]